MKKDSHTIISDIGTVFIICALIAFVIKFIYRIVSIM